MSASYTDPGARELARRLSALSAGKAPEPSGHRVSVAETPDERWSRLGQLALNIAPVVLPVLGKLMPRQRAAGATSKEPVPKTGRRKPFFNRWRLFRLGALALGVTWLRFRPR